MSQQLFEVSGISLDGAISILYGTDVPGTAQDTIDAPQGSVYFDTAGATWKKMAAGAGIDKWNQNSGGGGVSGINALRGIVGNTVVDSLDATVMDTGVWAITTSSAATPANHQTVIITGSHNGTVAKYSLYSRLDFGTKIAGITYDVRLNSGKFELMVFAPIQANIDCYRLNAVSNGSTVTLVTSGGGSGSGGGVDLTPQLNAEISARTAADSALTTAIANKADIAGLATQFTTINNQIAAETSARIAADTALQAVIDALPTDDDSGLVTVTTLTASIAAEAAARTSAIDAVVAGAITPAQLASAIAALPSDNDTALATTTSLTAAIDAEATARDAAIATAIAAIPPSSGTYSLPTASGSVLGGVKVGTGLSVDGSGVLSATGTSTASGDSITKTFTKVAHGFVFGQSISRSPTGWVLGSAATDTNAEISGIVTAVTTDTFTLTMMGYASGFTGLVDGSTYYLSDITAGDYTDTSPSAVDTVSKPIFIAISATEALIIQSRGILN